MASVPTSTFFLGPPAGPTSLPDMHIFHARLDLAHHSALSAALAIIGWILLAMSFGLVWLGIKCLYKCIRRRASPLPTLASTYTTSDALTRRNERDDVRKGRGAPWQGPRKADGRPDLRIWVPDVDEPHNRLPAFPPHALQRS
jgi:hypothetical protein